MSYPQPHNVHGCCPAVRPPDREADSLAFSTAVTRLFTILADIGARATRPTPLSLEFLTAERVSKSEERLSYGCVPCRPLERGTYQHSKRQVDETIAVSGKFELRPICDIPQIAHVATLIFRGLDKLKELKPTWLQKIAPQLPDLDMLDVTTYAEYSTGRRKRHAQRESK